MPRQDSDARKATRDIYGVLKGIYKRYSRTARQRSWERLTSAEGERIVKRIIQNPSVPTPGLDRLAFATFREWLESQ